MDAIPIPEATQARLERMITERNAIDAQIDAVVATLREVLDVPPHYTIGDIRAGFVAPPNVPVQEG